MRELISTDLTQANVDRALQLLADTYPTLAGLSAGLSDRQLRQPLGKGERSMTEDLAGSCPGRP